MNYRQFQQFQRMQEQIKALEDRVRHLEQTKANKRTGQKQYRKAAA